MGRVYMVIVLCTLAGCRSEVEPRSPPRIQPAPVSYGTSEPESAESPEPEPEPEPEADGPVALTAAPTMVGEAQIWRQSKTRQPPWELIEIVTVMFGVAPSVGEAVTILPLHPTLPVLELPITKVIIHDELVDEGGQPWWEAQLEPVIDKAYFQLSSPSPEFPARVVVVFPATPSATLLDVKQLSADDLPPGVLLAGVEIAVDVNGDRRPDTIELSVCTEDPKRASCGEATGTEIHRYDGGAWSLVHRFEPST